MRSIRPPGLVTLAAASAIQNSAAAAINIAPDLGHVDGSCRRNC